MAIFHCYVSSPEGKSGCPKSDHYWGLRIWPPNPPRSTRDLTSQDSAPGLTVQVLSPPHNVSDHDPVCAGAPWTMGEDGWRWWSDGMDPDDLLDPDLETAKSSTRYAFFDVECMGIDPRRGKKGQSPWESEHRMIGNPKKITSQPVVPQAETFLLEHTQFIQFICLWVSLP